MFVHLSIDKLINSKLKGHRNQRKMVFFFLQIVGVTSTRDRLVRGFVQGLRTLLSNVMCGFRQLVIGDVTVTSRVIFGVW